MFLPPSITLFISSHLRLGGPPPSQRVTSSLGGSRWARPPHACTPLPPLSRGRHSPSEASVPCSGTLASSPARRTPGGGCALPEASSHSLFSSSPYSRTCARTTSTCSTTCPCTASPGEPVRGYRARPAGARSMPAHRPLRSDLDKRARLAPRSHSSFASPLGSGCRSVPILLHFPRRGRPFRGDFE